MPRASILGPDPNWALLILQYCYLLSIQYQDFINHVMFVARPMDKSSLFYGGPEECVQQFCGIDFILLDFIVGQIGMTVE